MSWLANLEENELIELLDSTTSMYTYRCVIEELQYRGSDYID